MSTANPFLDSIEDLYANSHRLARRTGALHRAKISGRHVADIITELAAPIHPSVIADLGCGRGTTTIHLASQFPAASVTGIDASSALLDAARARTHTPNAQFICGDFHRLPLRSHACDLAVAAFCLYHAVDPAVPIKEISRCLRSRGLAILVTKSADSYAELDELVAASGLDENASSRPSLYQTAHGAVLPNLVAMILDVRCVINERHVFRFSDLGHLAEYLSTSPKYRIPSHLKSDPDALARELRRRFSDRPVVTSSLVTYIVATASESL